MLVLGADEGLPGAAVGVRADLAEGRAPAVGLPHLVDIAVAGLVEELREGEGPPVQRQRANLF